MKTTTEVSTCGRFRIESREECLSFVRVELGRRRSSLEPGTTVTVHVVDGQTFEVTVVVPIPYD